MHIYIFLFVNIHFNYDQSLVETEQILQSEEAYVEHNIYKGLYPTLRTPTVVEEVNYVMCLNVMMYDFSQLEKCKF